jgi:prolipoprotein diacylglyceryl transferase
VSLLASFPSPHRGTIGLGPLTVHMYGLTLLVAIAACIGLTGIRWVRRGGDWDLVLRVAVWGVAFGVIGARLYHDITSWNEVPDQWWGAFAVWKGGLGVWGGIFLGCLAGAVVVHRSGQSVRAFMDAVAPGLLLAQGIGRWGNWWNQELYGKPTDLPWALDIDYAHCPTRYQNPLEGTCTRDFHPTFLYEFVYDLVGVGLLLAIDRRYRIKPPALFALYVSYYTFGRFFEELLRIDPAHELFGLRVNAYVSIVVFVCSTAFFVWWQFFRRDSGQPRISRTMPPKGPAMAVPRGRVRPPR